MSRQGDPTARCLTTERTWKLGFISIRDCRLIVQAREYPGPEDKNTKDANDEPTWRCQQNIPNYRDQANELINGSRNSVGIKRGDMWIGSIMMYFIDVQTRQMTSGMQCQDSQQNSRNNVLSMSRQGDPTARCLTTERTIQDQRQRQSIIQSIEMVSGSIRSVLMAREL